jgi:hypothetical protein
MPVTSYEYVHSYVYTTLKFVTLQGAPYIHCGLGSSVGIAAGYGLDVSGIESRWGRDFSHTSRPALGPGGKATEP